MTPAEFLANHRDTRRCAKALVERLYELKIAKLHSPAWGEVEKGRNFKRIGELVRRVK